MCAYIAAVVLCVCVLYVLGTWVRLQLRWRRWLRSVPGPPRTSFWYGNLYELLKRDIVPVFLEWTAQYGRVVRVWGTFGEPRLLVSDPVTMDYIFRRRAYAYPKVRVVRRMLGGIMGQGMLVAEGDAHRRQKGAIQPGFSVRSVRKLTPVFQQCAHALQTHLASLVQDNGALVDVYKLMGCTALDALGLAAFHIEFGSLAQVESAHDGRTRATHPLTAAFERAMDVATHNSVTRNLFDALSMIFPVLEQLPIGIESRTFREAAQVLFDVAAQIVQEAKTSVLGEAEMYRTHTAAERPDLLAAMLRANANAQRPHYKKRSVLDKAVLSDAELAAQLSTLIFAGHETTATQTTWLLHMLAEHPAAQDRLRAELRTAYKHNELQSLGADRPEEPCATLPMDVLEALPYLDWCIRESLRLQSAIHTTSRTASEPDVLPCSDGRRVLIDKDTVIMVPLAAISRDPQLWGSDAHVFRPERWADPMPGSSTFASYGGVSFLLGPRACIGRHFAIAEMKVFVSTLINTFQFSTDGRRTLVKRWIVSRPYDVRTRQDACLLRVRRAP